MIFCPVGTRFSPFGADGLAGRLISLNGEASRELVEFVE